MAADPQLAEKVQAALAKSGGNRRLAQSMLLTWAMEDAALLRALVAPYLTGIVGRAIDAARAPAARPASAKAADRVADATAPVEDREKAPMTDDLLDRLADQLGEHFDRTPRPAAEGAARQASSLRTLAVAHARRRYDPDRPDD